MSIRTLTCRTRFAARRLSQLACRGLLTLAIETSCDDTSVAVLETRNSSCGPTSAILHYHKKVTSNNTQYQGVHPLAALCSHQENLVKLVDEAILHLPPRDAPHRTPEKGVSSAADSESTSFRSKRLPDFISVTRGPGMRSNLFTGIDTAKGLAAAWQIDLLGVHHMQAHALTPRLVAALQNTYRPDVVLQAAQPRAHGTRPDYPTIGTNSKIEVEPDFPFLSVLASGGHTLLIQSTSLTDHHVLGSTGDVAVGECLDKVARVVLPSELLQTAKSTMYGALLERFAFSQSQVVESGKGALNPKIEDQGQGNFFLEDSTAEEYRAMYATRYTYTVPRNQEEALRQNTTKWGWNFNQPLAKAGGGVKSKSLEMSFSGLMTAAERAASYQRDSTTGKQTRLVRPPGDLTMEERRDIAREVMRAAFEHISTRVVLGLQHILASPSRSEKVPTVVMSGGVAANSFLRYMYEAPLISSISTAAKTSCMSSAFNSHIAPARCCFRTLLTLEQSCQYPCSAWLSRSENSLSPGSSLHRQRGYDCLGWN
ncbi:uncharacterized protein EI97DRAFT_378569 [Westerdykella ornata]|uniref:Gcp-like domain-containing protein n=1 Tax=Westerdykella ornata TaxID=318751 RepID=A0A6A6JII0_WESOR|nr:uncharacterized protein EI97DRAFT_378569 [Westerdykella ornata]KAF2275903.1 hypothetical protein EI97DRAFT_378569 [Westerdykella ornata]